MAYKNKFKKFLLYLLGRSKEFSAEHQFFNITCLLVAFSYFIMLLLNAWLQIEPFITLKINFFAFIIIVILYYLSRFRKWFCLPVLLFFGVIFASLSYKWFFVGGTNGVIIYYYFSVLSLILFIPYRKLKIALVIILILNVSILYYLEYKYPQWIIPYSNRLQQFLHMYICFIYASSLITIVVITAKRLYLREKQKIIELKEKISNKKEFNEKLNEIFNVLSIQEQNIFNFIIEGCSNKEIADKLHINVCTVKTHINNIYRKSGVHRRTDLKKLLYSM